MLNSKECVAHAFGGAVFGVAVGMVMQKILSPRSVPQPPKSADKNLVVCCEKVKKRSRSSDLRVPSDRHKNSRHRRSKSSSGSKRGEKELKNLSAPNNSQHNVSEMKLRSSSTAKNEASEKLSLKSDEKSVEYFLNTSTEYRPFVSKAPEKLCDIIDLDFDPVLGRKLFETASTEYMPLKFKKSSKKDEKGILIFDINNRMLDSTASQVIGDIFFNTPVDYSLLKSKLLKKTTDKIDGTFHSDSERKFFETMSTKYLSLKLKKKSENAVPSIFLIEVNNQDSDFINTEINDCSINATCDTESWSLNTEFNRESTEILSTEYLIRREVENASKGDVPPVFEIVGNKSSMILQEFNSVPNDSNLENKIANCSINATCNTLDKEFKFDSYLEEHSAESTEELLKFVTLPTFIESGHISTTEFDEY